MSAVVPTTYTSTRIGYPQQEGYMNHSPSSRFTAVNGRDSSAPAGPVNGEAGSDTLAETKARPRPTQPHANGTEYYRTEKLKLSTDKGDWPRNQSIGEVSHSSSSTSHQSQSSTMQQSDSSMQSPHKRKRSDSPARRHSSSASYTSHGLPRSPRTTTHHHESGFVPDAMDPHRRQGSRSPRRGSYTISQSQQYPPGAGRDREHSLSGASTYYGQGAQAQRQPYDPPRSTTPGHESHSDNQLAEALRRESQNLDAAQESRMGTSPEEDDNDQRSQSQGTGDYDSNRTPSSGVQVDHRRRKRVFSNRTKTGCMTCRRRKKKCDEQKPECEILQSSIGGNNCIRGGFVCEGYSNRIEWQKTSRDKPPVPLQAKEGEQIQGQYAQSSMGTSQASMGQPHGGEDSPSAYRTSHGPPAISGGSARPILVDEERERGSGGASPPGNSQAPSQWQKQGWSTQNNPSHHAEQPNPDVVRVPSISEMPRPVEEPNPPHSAVGPRALLHPPHSNSPQTPQQAQIQAQLALQHQASLRRAPQTEKEKMLAGDLYFPFSNELVYERERCKAAIWRFNNSMNPNSGISREERARLFRDIVQPKDGPPTAGSPTPVGRVGENAVVEAPFNCDYGYNITIGADVFIGTNCTIMDTCSVTIGSRTVISPNVNLLTATMPIDPRRRKGSQGPSLGRSIVIEEDCWIGAGVIILPGRKVGRSSTVGAGSVVTRDVPRFTVVAGNPARVHRGIYANDPNV
ncbi:MAG: Maltose acetyltransferase [Sclerophora amabilis]|nr:MAG: Maltose acetyltransferase [Sclerophora amabilis]